MVGRLLVGGQEAVLLVGEDLVEGAARDPGALEDLVDRRVEVALLGDHLGEGVQQPSALDLVDDRARDPWGPPVSLILGRLRVSIVAALPLRTTLGTDILQDRNTAILKPLYNAVPIGPWSAGASALATAQAVGGADERVQACRSWRSASARASARCGPADLAVDERVDRVADRFGDERRMVSGARSQAGLEEDVEGPDRPIAALEAPGPGGECVDDRDAAAAGSAARKPNSASIAGVDAPRPVGRGLVGGSGGGQRLLALAVQRGDQRLLLVLEVAVEGAQRCRGALGDLDDRRIRVATVGDRLGDRGDEPLARDVVVGRGAAPRSGLRRGRSQRLGRRS